MGRRSSYATVLAAASLAAGCNGGTVDRHALKQDSDAIDSLACEGALLAHDVARGRSTTFFARVHSGELAQRASNFEDALSERPTLSGIEARVRAEARRAGRIARLLDELHRHPADDEVAAGLRPRLEQVGDCR
jgi:hypothetical protein